MEIGLGLGDPSDWALAPKYMTANILLIDAVLEPKLHTDVTMTLFQENEKSPWRPMTTRQKAVNCLKKCYSNSQATKKSSHKEWTFSCLCEAARVPKLLNSFSWLHLVTQPPARSQHTTIDWLTPNGSLCSNQDGTENNIPWRLVEAWEKVPHASPQMDSRWVVSLPKLPGTHPSWHQGKEGDQLHPISSYQRHLKRISILVHGQTCQTLRLPDTSTHLDSSPEEPAPAAQGPPPLLPHWGGGQVPAQVLGWEKWQPEYPQQSKCHLQHQHLEEGLGAGAGKQSEPSCSKNSLWCLPEPRYLSGKIKRNSKKLYPKLFINLTYAYLRTTTSNVFYCVLNMQMVYLSMPRHSRMLIYIWSIW